MGRNVQRVWGETSKSLGRNVQLVWGELALGRNVQIPNRVLTRDGITFVFFALLPLLCNLEIKNLI